MDTLKVGENWPLAAPGGINTPGRMNPATQPGWPATGLNPPRPKRTTLAYRALLLFSFVYFVRPEDFIPGLGYLYLAKILGAVALLALIFGVKRSERGKIALEGKILLVLLVHMCLTIPTSYWRGGSYDVVVNRFSKGVIIALLIPLVVTGIKELRRLLFIQAAAITLVTFASILVHHTMDGRLMGIQKGILENPNDLAINIAINFPLCMGFLLAAKKGIPKVLWTAGLFCILYGVVATYSRSGMIAMTITGLICLWEFGVKGKRFMLLASTAICAVLAFGALLASPRYLNRIASLVATPDPSVIGTGTMESHGEASLQARTELLKDSLRFMAKHPIFGIGPGTFPAVTGEWRVVHNTYTELGAEAGIPALLLFVALLITAGRRVRGVHKLPGYAADPSIRLWSSALWAGLAGYSAGALFASTEYTLFPYFMVGYICALYQIASKPAETNAEQGSRNGNGNELDYGRNREREL
ncbi:MAG TPA: O-antigen ligase family protein, partial [Terriglobales bacterium]|nr:O-antigen ligase family protein [Terriglobales bacterium]